MLRASPNGDKRAEREWVHRAAKGRANTIAFGSTKNLKVQNTAIFVNCPFPTLEEDAAAAQPVQIGPYSRTPYDWPSFFNISGMSYGHYPVRRCAPCRSARRRLDAG